MTSKVSVQEESIIQIGTIRERVTAIKSHWTNEERLSRAREGTKRRQELELLLGHLNQSTPQTEHRTRRSKSPNLLEQDASLVAS